MATMVPPPMHPKRFPTKGSKPHKMTRAPTRSARRDSRGSVSTGTDVPHMIRVTVLGLAGLTVDEDKCRNGASKGPGVKNLPPPPSNMRAIVAFSRSGDIRGTTTLSKPLSRSPKNQILCSGSREDDDHLTGTGDEGDNMRHVAVWASGEKQIGSEVSFEATLHRSDMKGGSGSLAASSSAFAPKSFDVTIALTEDDDSETKIAIPLGIANLAVAGDECADGEAVTLDLPVMSLEQAQPLASAANKSGTSEYPLISIQRKNAIEDSAELAKKKKGSLKRRFFKHKTPTVIDRKAFRSAYSIDSGGDAVLRVTLEVYEKGMEDLFGFRRRQRQATAAAAPQLPQKAPKDDISVPSDEGRWPVVRKASSGSHPDDEVSAISQQLQKVAMERLASVERARQNETPPDRTVKDEIFEVDDDESRTEESFYTDGTWTEDGEGSTLDSATLKTDDEYTLSFSPKEKSTEKNSEDANSIAESLSEKFVRNLPGCHGLLETNDGNLFLNLFGRKVQVPSCRGPSQDDFEYDDNGNARVMLDMFGHQFKIPVCTAMVPMDDDEEDDDDTLGTRWDEEFTMVSAKLFGHKVHVPFPRHLIAQNDDNDTVTTATAATDHSGSGGRSSLRSKGSESRNILLQAQETFSAYLPNPYHQRANVGSTFTFEDTTLGETTISFIDGSLATLTQDDDEAMVVEIDQDHASSESEPSIYKQTSIPPIQDGSAQVERGHQIGSNSQKTPPVTRQRSKASMSKTPSVTSKQRSKASISKTPSVTSKQRSKASISKTPSVTSKQRSKFSLPKTRGDQVGTARTKQDCVNSKKKPAAHVRSSKSSKRGARCDEPRMQKEEVGVVEIDQDRAESESEPSIYRLPRERSIESFSLRPSKLPNKDEMIVEIDQDHAESESDPSIYKLPVVKKTATNCSPNGVDDINDLYSPPAQSIQGHHLEHMRPITMAQAFADFITCRNPVSVGHVTYQTFREEVPPVIIGAQDDDSSIGALTATTHEQRIASARKLGRKRPDAKKKTHERNDSGSTWNFSIPEFVPEVATDEEGEESILGAKENYFSEYGDDNSLHPMNGKQLSTPEQKKKDEASSKNSPGWIQPWVEEATPNRFPSRENSGDSTSKKSKKTGRYFSSEKEQEVTQYSF